MAEVSEYSIEWQFTPSATGGAWGGEWLEHSWLGYATETMAKDAFGQLLRGFNPEFRKHFRLLAKRPVVVMTGDQLNPVFRAITGG